MTISQTDRAFLEPMASGYLRAMMLKARSAARIHDAGCRAYMAELCTKRADACAVLLGERGER